MASGHLEPLLGAAGGRDDQANKHSSCHLNETCFLNDGSRKESADQRKVQRKLACAICLCAVFMCVEVVGGYIAGSIAILADAAHMLSDVAGFAVSLFAAWAVTRKSAKSYSFGYHRIEILGALASVMTIWAVTGALVWEAIQRILNPQPVDGKVMFIVASAGVCFNIVIALVLGEHHVHGPGSAPCGGHGHSHGDGHSHGGGHSHAAPDYSHDHTHDGHDNGHSADSSDDEHGHSHGHANAHNKGSCCIITVPVEGAGAGAAATVAQASEAVIREGGHSPDENINLRSAVLHVIGDLLQSIGVAIAGALIWWKSDDPRWQVADPICTCIFALLVLLTSKNILADIVHTLMERTPPHLDLSRINTDMAEMEGVLDVHDLHVWNLSLGIPILTAHVHVSRDHDSEVVLKKLEEYSRRLGVRHCTIQICNPPVLLLGPAASAPPTAGAIPGPADAV